MATGTSTVSVLVVAPGHEAQEIEVVQGTTVAGLAALAGLDNADRLPAIDEMGTTLRPSDIVTEETGCVSYVFKLAGASA